MRKELSDVDVSKFYNAVNVVAQNLGINPPMKLFDLAKPFPGSIFVKISAFPKDIQKKLVDKMKETSEEDMNELLLTFLLKNEAIDTQFAYQKLRAETFSRQGNLCAVAGCGEPCTNLHHYNSANFYPELKHESWNVIGICIKHHKLITQQQQESVNFFSRKTRETNPKLSFSQGVQPPHRIIPRTQRRRRPNELCEVFYRFNNDNSTSWSRAHGGSCRQPQPRAPARS